MRQVAAIIAAFMMSALVGLAMLGVGVNARLNRNVVQTVDAPASSNVSLAPQGQLEQMQNLISQYQARDQEYQSQLNTVMQQLNQRNSQVQQFTRLLLELQNHGLIFIQPDGTILLPGD